MTNKRNVHYRLSLSYISTGPAGGPKLKSFIVLSPDEIYSVYHMPYSVQCFIGADGTEMVLAIGFGWFVEL